MSSHEEADSQDGTREPGEILEQPEPSGSTVGEVGSENGAEQTVFDRQSQPTAIRTIQPEQIERARTLIEIYRREVSTAPATLAVQILCVMARLFEEVLGDTRSAFQVLSEALRRDPTSPALVQTILRLMVDRRHQHRAATLLAEVAEAVDSIPFKVGLLLDLAALQERALRSDTQAVLSYQQALSIDPGNLEAAESLLALLWRNKHWEEVASLCTALAQGEADPETRFSLLMTAAVLAGKEAAGARMRLATLALDAGSDWEVALALALAGPPDQTDWEEIARLLVGQIEARPDQAGPLSFLLSRVQANHLHQLRQATTSAEAAAAAAPRDLVILDWLADLYRQEARWAELVDVLRTRMGLVSRAEDLVEILVSLAEIYETRLDQPEKAIEELEAALAISPLDVPVLQSLGGLYAQTGRWEDLVQMHLAEAGGSRHPGRGARALYRCSCILEEKLSNREAAIAHLEQALLLDSSFGPIVRLLEELYQKEQRDTDLLDLLAEQLKSVSTEERRIELLEQIADILYNRLGELDQAKQTYLELLQLRPDHLPALNALVLLYERSQEYHPMLATLRTLVGCQANVRQKAELLSRMGQIWEEKLGDSNQALLHYQEALACDPSLPELYQHLGRLFYANRQWPELVDLYRQEIAVTQDESDRVRLLFRIGRLQEQQLDLPEQASETYHQALQLDRSYWPALRGVLRVGRQLGAFQEVAELEGSLLKDAPPDAGNAPAFVRVGLLLDEETGAPEQAEVLYEKAREKDPKNHLARMLLLRSLMRRGGWERLAEELPPLSAAMVMGAGTHNSRLALDLLRRHEERQPGSLAVIRWRDTWTGAARDHLDQAKALAERLEREGDPRRKTAILKRLAAMAEYGQTSEHDPEELYRRLLEDNPEDHRILNALVRVARKRGDNQLLIEVLHRQAQIAETPERKSLALSSLADLLMSTEQVEPAIGFYRQALEDDPCCRTAYDTLKGWYWGRSDRQSLGWVLQTGLDCVTHPDALSVDLILRSDIRMEQGDWKGALDDLDRALSVKPALPGALERIDRILRERRDFEGLVERLARAAEQTSSSSLKSAIHLQIGLVYLDEHGDLREAERYLGLSVQANPDNAKALLAMANLRVKMDQPTEAMVLLNRVALRTRDQEDLFQAHLDIARICRDILGDPARARASLDAILARDPDYLPALRQMTDLAKHLKDDLRREESLKKLGALETDPEVRAQYILELSDHLGQRYGWDSPQVLEALEQAVAQHPKRVDILARLVELYRSAGQWEAVDRILLEHINDLSEADRPSYLLLRATILEKYLGKHQEARDVARQLLRLQPDNEQVARLLLGWLAATPSTDPLLVDEIISLHRVLLKGDPLSTASIRALYELCQQAGRADESFCAGSCLVLLGDASEEEAYFQKQRRRKVPVRPTGSLTSGVLSGLALPEGDHPLRTLLRLLRPHAAQLLPVDLRQYGIASLDEARLPPEHPARQVLQHCADLLGVEGFEVVEALGGVPRGTVEPADPPFILLPRDLLGLPVPAQRFLCGRLLARVEVATESFEPGRLEPLSLRDLEILLTALCRTGEPAYGEGVAAKAILDDMTEQIMSTLPPEVLSNAREKARSILGFDADELKGWIRSTELGACIGGLICCGDVMSAWEALKRTTDEPVPEEILGDLVWFTTSEQFASYRKLLGLALSD
ncbi:MAG: tetratricopeptide repeat protein [Bradymonadales bacterium]|nr:tetratricopeptide repeat protein [Bradymonadales bacterium]